MIDLYFATSPNVYKIIILLEELAEEYNLMPTDLTSGVQFEPEKMAGVLTGKVPIVIDREPVDGGDPVTIFESGEILHYLALKHGQFLPRDARLRSEVMQWLFWQVSGLGPFSGQCFHFRAVGPVIAPEADMSYGKARYEKIMSAHWSVMERRLADRDYLAGEYSIADIACFPWIRYLGPAEGRDCFPNVARWQAAIERRPAIGRAYDRASRVDMGVGRNELGTAIYSADRLRDVIVF